MQTIEEIVQWLDSKFESMHPIQDWYKYKKWYLNRYIYYGADYGIQLMYREERKVWIMVQMVESGYATGRVLLETEDWEEIFPWVEVMTPTNPEYKTDRK